MVLLTCRLTLAWKTNRLRNRGLLYPNEPTICAGADMPSTVHVAPFQGGGTPELYRLLTHARNLIDSMGTRSSNASIPFKRPLMVGKQRAKRRRMPRKDPPEHVLVRQRIGPSFRKEIEEGSKGTVTMSIVASDQGHRSGARKVYCALGQAEQ